MRLVLLSLALGAASLPVAMPEAFALDCQARIDAMSPQAQSIRNERIRQLFQFDLKRAAAEITESDQAECTEALDHAASLLEMK